MIQIIRTKRHKLHLLKNIELVELAKLLGVLSESDKEYLLSHIDKELII